MPKRRRRITPLSNYLWRRKIGIREFSRKVKVSPTTVSRIASGENVPRWATIAKIDKATKGEVKRGHWLAFWNNEDSLGKFNP